MTLRELTIQNLRNLNHLKLSFHPHLNIISGPNGIGKTTLLEAIYLLSCAKSFRTHEISSLVTHGLSTFTLHGKRYDDYTMAIQKSLSAPSVMKINDDICSSSVEFARSMPTQLFYQDIFQIIDSGPATRRSVLDWGLFHVKHHYYQLWKNYRRVLKQRNSLLRQNAKSSEFVPWDELLANLGHEMDLMRQEYVDNLACEFKSTLAAISDLDCTLDYFRGWGRRNELVDLKTVLSESLNSDRQYKYTRYGAHQADLLFLTNEHKAKHALSRGQQKIILFALKISQVKLLDKPCIYIIDDLFAEFDGANSRRLLEYLIDLKGQLFITCHDGLPSDLDHNNYDYSDIKLTGDTLIKDFI